MAVNVSQKYREVIYSGGAIHRATLTINGTQVPNSNIKKITITSPIIDKTQEYFYIGTFVAQKVEIEFRNADNIDLNGIVVLSIGTKTDEPEYADENGYENVDIGQYYIDTTPEDYYKMAKITCYDKSILFKKNVDISQWFDENGKITAENLLKALCSYFLGEDMLGTYPTLHRELTTGSYDNTKSGKYYISQIAEIMGCNAKIGRDGKLYLLPLKRPSTVTINALKSKSWELSTKYRISRVFYDNGDNIYEAGNTTDNSLNIRVDNIFMNGNDNNMQTIIDDLYNELNGFEMYAVKNENYGDPSLDCWDLIEFTLGENSYNALNDNVLVFEMNIATTINPTIPSKQKQQVTNVISRENNIINIMKTEIDQVNNRVTQTNTRVGDVESELQNNVYSKEQTNQLIRDAENGLTNLFTNGGGNNLLTNTAPYRYIGDNKLENWEGNITGKDELASINKKALLLLAGTAYQQVDVQSGVYAVGFKFKRLREGATLRIEYNGRTIDIDNEDNITINDVTNYRYDEINNEITTFGEINGNSFIIQFTTSTDRAFEIYELRLVHGSTILAWTQNQNEFKTTSVNIGEGITISSNQANTINKLDTYGMVVYNADLYRENASDNTEAETLRATNEGIITKDLTSTGKSNVSGMLVQRINKKHIFVTGIVEE